ncbi:MAG: hypothetical protein ACREPW_01555 [Candidatus Binataceae bacterium]
MQETKSKEQAQDFSQQDFSHQDCGHKDSRRQNTKLDERYGKIGISAVAAAVCHQGEQRNRREARETSAKRD